jgi:hypothetical protein
MARTDVDEAEGRALMYALADGNAVCPRCAQVWFCFGCDGDTTTAKASWHVCVACRIRAKRS